jgi:iron complex transport system substrate-binding protein
MELVARVILLVLVMMVPACREGGSAAPAGAGGDVRIVSLSPALSRTAIDLGLEERIVGRSTYCEFLDGVPVIGDLQRIDYERLIDVRPTHVLVQAPADGIDTRLVELGASRGWKIASWSGVDTIDDIERVLREMPGALAEPGTPQLDALSRRAADLLNEIAAALSPGRGEQPLYSGRVLLVHGTEPIQVFGTSTYLHEVLLRLGASNAAAVRGWATLSLEDLVHIDPPAIILVQDASKPPTSAEEGLGPIASMSLQAAEGGRLAVVRHPDALRPCTGIIGLADEMRAALHRLAADGADGP